MDLPPSLSHQVHTMTTLRVAVRVVTMDLPPVSLSPGPHHDYTACGCTSSDYGSAPVSLSHQVHTVTTLRVAVQVVTMDLPPVSLSPGPHHDYTACGCTSSDYGSAPRLSLTRSTL
jgi:hypothetical protein